MNMTNDTKKIAAIKSFTELRARMFAFVEAFGPIDAYVDELPVLEGEPLRKAIDGDVRALADRAWNEIGAVMMRLATIRRGGAPTPNPPIETAADMMRIVSARTASLAVARGLLDDYLAEPGAYDDDRLRGATTAAFAVVTELTQYVTAIHERAWSFVQARATDEELRWHTEQNAAASDEVSS
jgi:hypothetical protein